MHVIEGRNVNDVLAKALPWLVVNGQREKSRNGDVIVAPGPVCSIYKNPTERVLFGAVRDANPFFHLMEALWMLAGRNDIAFPVYFNKRFADYSDDGITAHGAYGHRWRRWFGMDQIGAILAELKNNPNSRRAVIGMWSPQGDLVALEDADDKGVYGGLTCKDVPCNTHIYFDMRHGRLNMTVCNRSNDAIWGAYGANVVHMSILQEYMACALGVECGMYRQFSNNFHAYTDVYSTEKMADIAREARKYNHYTNTAGEGERTHPFKLMTVDVQEWNDNLRAFIEMPEAPHIFSDPFFATIVQPMYMAYAYRKDKRGSGLEFIEEMPECDWKIACTEWIQRREDKKEEAV